MFTDAVELSLVFILGLTSVLVLSGIHWNIMENAAYTHYTTCPSPNQIQSTTTEQNVTQQTCLTATPTNGINYQQQISNSPPQMIQKRKRNVNPQADENFIRALEAVRYGGIGFCKAARMYGVNNRTLWLEYKKRGYPNFRSSIKNRKQETVQTADVNNQTSSSPPPEETLPRQESEEMMAPNPVTLLNNTFFDKPVDLGPMLQRPKFLDPGAILNAQQAINFQGLTFEHI